MAHPAAGHRRSRRRRCMPDLGDSSPSSISGPRSPSPSPGWSSRASLAGEVKDPGGRSRARSTSRRHSSRSCTSRARRRVLWLVPSEEVNIVSGFLQALAVGAGETGLGLVWLAPLAATALRDRQHRRRRRLAHRARAGRVRHRTRPLLPAGLRPGAPQVEDALRGDPDPGGAGDRVPAALGAGHGARRSRRRISSCSTRCCWSTSSLSSISSCATWSSGFAIARRVGVPGIPAVGGDHRRRRTLPHPLRHAGRDRSPRRTPHDPWIFRLKVIGGAGMFVLLGGAGVLAGKAMSGLPPHLGRRFRRGPLRAGSRPARAGAQAGQGSPPVLLPRDAHPPGDQRAQRGHLVARTGRS